MVSDRMITSTLFPTSPATTNSPPLLVTSSATSSSLRKSRFALSPSPSNVVPLCPPRSLSSSYASLMALNFSRLESGLRSGCSVAIFLR